MCHSYFVSNGFWKALSRVLSCMSAIEQKHNQALIWWMTHQLIGVLISVIVLLKLSINIKIKLISNTELFDSVHSGTHLSHSERNETFLRPWIYFWKLCCFFAGPEYCLSWVWALLRTFPLLLCILRVFSLDAALYLFTSIKKKKLLRR